MGKKMLYVISHDDEGQNHPIYQYAVNGNVLEWVRAYNSPLLNSPNSVMAFPDGSLLVTNDSRKRGNKVEKLLAKKVCTIVHFSPEGEASIAADHITYANGINYQGQDVYISSTTGNRLLLYQYADGKLIAPEKVCRLPGPDNIRWHQDKLIIACHPRSFAFIRHVSHAEKASPSQIYEVDPATGNRTVLYGEFGYDIPAASTGIVVGNHLWIGQVFNPWLLVVDLGTGESSISLKK
jgi:sugar lactone lactonase YvrE